MATKSIKALKVFFAKSKSNKLMKHKGRFV